LPLLILCLTTNCTQYPVDVISSFVQRTVSFHGSGCASLCNMGR
jgi:hypothetical protein